MTSPASAAAATAAVSPVVILLPSDARLWLSGLYLHCLLLPVAITSATNADLDDSGTSEPLASAPTSIQAAAAAAAVGLAATRVLRPPADSCLSPTAELLSPPSVLAVKRVIIDDDASSVDEAASCLSPAAELLLSPPPVLAVKRLVIKDDAFSVAVAARVPAPCTAAADGCVKSEDKLLVLVFTPAAAAAAVCDVASVVDDSAVACGTETAASTAGC